MMDEWTPASLVVSSLGMIVTLLLGMLWWFLRRTITENDRAHGAMVNDITDLKTDMAVVKTDVAGLKADMTVVKTDVAGLKADMAVVKTDVAGLKADVTDLKADMAAVNANTAAVNANMAALRTLVEQQRPEAARE